MPSLVFDHFFTTNLKTYGDKSAAQIEESIIPPPMRATEPTSPGLLNRHTEFLSYPAPPIAWAARTEFTLRPRFARTGP